MANFLLFFTSGIVSLFVYIILLFLLFFALSNDDVKPKEVSFIKETSFNIELVEEAKPVIKKEVVRAVNKEKKQENIPIKKESASKTANVGLGVNELFKQVDSKKPVQKEALKPQSINDVVAKRKKSNENSQKDDLNDKLNKIMSNLELHKTMNFSVPKGQYDEFYSKVQEILYENWNPETFGKDLKSDVIITIDSMGTFSYRIIKKSNSIEFDNALIEFLDIMKTKEFPRYKGGDKTNIVVTFKTEV